MQLEYRKLSGDEIDRELNRLSGWRIEGDKLVKNFEFESYREGVDFACRVADVAEELDHHPDMELGYSKVRVSVSTHSVEGLSPYDFEFARRADEI